MNARTFLVFLFVAWGLPALAGPSIVLAAPEQVPAEEAPTLPPPEVRAWQTGLLRADRLEHASLSWTLGLAIGLATREPAAVLGGTFSLGLVKELLDRRRTGFDTIDLAADLVGGGAAALATAAWRR